MNIGMDAGEFVPSRVRRLRRIVATGACALWSILFLAAGSIAGLMKTSPLVSMSILSMVGLGPENPFESRNELFILILGCDLDYDDRDRVISEYARTDSIQLVRLDFKNNAIGMLAIPRDTYVNVPGYREHRINVLHRHGGPEATAEAVYRLIGIRPDKIVVLNFKAIVKMVDLVGGVEVYIDKRMKYTDRSGGLYIDFRPGRTVLDGEDALGYLRYRRDSDLDRGKRQHEFLVAFRQKVMQNPQSIPELTNLFMELIGGALTETEVFHIADFVRNVQSSRIRHAVLPVEEGPNYYYIPIESKIPDVLVQAGIKSPLVSGSRTVSVR